jgi:hypothetical protein
MNRTRPCCSNVRKFLPRHRPSVVCAAMGMTTQSEAAKRIPTGHIVLEGCAHWAPALHDMRFVASPMMATPDPSLRIPFRVGVMELQLRCVRKAAVSCFRFLQASRRQK